MCRFGKPLGLALIGFGLGILLSLLIGSVFLCALLAIAAVGAGAWLVLSKG